jgi:RNA polymerase sigma factor (sigma-70 family)
MTESLHAVPQPVPEAESASTAEAASNAEAFETFVDAERVRLLGALVVMTGNRAEAEELLQDAFLKVWERWDRVAAMENPAGYLYRTALNLYRRCLRRASVATRKAFNLLPDVDELAGVDIRDEAVRLLGKLTPRERAAIVITAYLGYSTEEAGRLMGINANTFRVLTGRARATLRAAEEAST